MQKLPEQPIPHQEPRYLFGWRRAPLTVLECWRNVVFFALCVLLFIGLSVQDVWQGGQWLKLLGHFLFTCMYLAYAQTAWQNLKRRQRGEIVYGVHLPRREGWGIIMGIGTIILVVFTYGMIADWADFPHGGHFWLDLALLLPSCLLLILGWRHLPKGE